MTLHVIDTDKREIVASISRIVDPDFSHNVACQIARQNCAFAADRAGYGRSSGYRWAWDNDAGQIPRERFATTHETL